MHYFVDVARLQQFAAVLLMRGGTRIGRPERRVLESILAAEDSPRTLARFAARGARELTGRPETLGAEWMLFGALLWRRLLSLSVRDRPQRRLRLDALPPPDLAPVPQRFEAGAEGSAARAIAEKIRPLSFALAPDAPPRVNVLIPTVDLDHLFAGYIGKFNLAVRLSQRGARVRIITVDPTPPLPRRWGRTLEAYEGLAGLTDRVEFAFGRETGEIEVSPRDAFIATTWWTAHVAHQAVTALGGVGGNRFLYLIQEYEPFTFPMGTYAALARQSYDLPHNALFSTELLRDYFRRHRIGVYAAGPKRGDTASAVFENAITAVPPPTASELAGRSTRRLLFYARPEPHAARNCFELGMLALMRAVDEGAFQDGWELRGIGAVRNGGRLALGAGASLELLPRSAPGRVRALPARARRGARADVHAAPEPRSDRDGLRGPAHRHQQLREQDAGRDGGDLGQPDHGRADGRIGGGGAGERGARRRRPRPSCGGGARQLEPRLGDVVRRRRARAGRRIPGRPLMGHLGAKRRPGSVAWR